MLLKKLKEAAEEFLGLKVTGVVISVPAYFNNKQQEETKEAGTIAGLNVLRLINEPTTVVVAYGMDNRADKDWDKDKVVLVLYLGGGTFDVSLLTVSKLGVINVISVGGDTHLGGEDFDTTLVNHCIKEFKKQHGEDISGNPRALGRLKVSCEKAKRELSSTISASIEIDCLFNGIDFSIKISRAKFEDLNAILFDKCIDVVHKCLRDGKILKKDVDDVVVVGGSTRIVKVQQMLKEFFDGKSLCKNMNSDEAVAFGAAVLAARLNGNGDNVMTSDVLLLDVTPLSLGIAADTRDQINKMSVIIPRNTSIPTTKKKIFYGKTVVDISVYQGESKRVVDNIFLGRFSIDNLTLVGPNGILHVFAQDTATGQTKNITFAYS